MPEWLPIAVASVTGVVLSGAISGLLVRYTARFTMGQPVKLNSAMNAGVLTVLTFAIITLAVVLVSGIVEPLLRPYLPWLIFVAWFLLAALINMGVMRKADGVSLSYSEACRVQLAPIAALLVFYVVFYRPLPE